MRLKVQQVESNLEASKGGRSEKHQQLEQKDKEITAYLKAYPEEKKKNVNGVLRAEKNIVTLLKHISGEMNRRTALPSRADVNQLDGELAFKQSQFENAESTLQRVQL